MNDLKSISNRIHKFFFQPEIPFALAICRIFASMVMMGMVWPRWLVCRELYSTDGATGQLSVGFLNYNMLPEFSGTVVAALYAIMLFSLVTMCIGWCSRISCITVFVLFTYFSLLDAVSTMTKYTAISSHVLLLLSVSPCGAIWSVDAWFANRKRNLDLTRPTFDYPTFAAWPRRLIQFHIALVYFGAGITKIKTPAFFTGDQLQYWMLTHLNFRHPIGEFFANYPFMLVAFAYVVVVWELVFIVAAWKSAWRTPMLAIGVSFHFMTTLTLGLIEFPMICYACYLSFFDEDDMRQMCAWLRKVCRKSDWLKIVLCQWKRLRDSMNYRPEWNTVAKVAFVFLLPIVAYLGIEIEYQFDIYNERSGQGLPQLVEMDAERARQMLAPTAAIRDIDKFFAVDMGTFLVCDFIADRRNTFRQGENVITQCNLVPPHEDMQIHARIRDSENQIVERMAVIATREMPRVNMSFRIADNLPPGEYTMSIETAGRHVMNRKFTVLPKYGTVALR